MALVSASGSVGRRPQVRRREAQSRRDVEALTDSLAAAREDAERASGACAAQGPVTGEGKGNSSQPKFDRQHINSRN